MAVIEERECPALVGRKEAAKLLSIKPENIYRIEGVPRPLQDRRIRGFDVSTGPLWPRVEIEALVKRVRAERRLRDAEARRRKKAKAGKRSPAASAAKR